MRSDARYAYVTVAIVAVVALLAVWLIIGVLAPDFSLPDNNRAGQAIAPIPGLTTLGIGETYSSSFLIVTLLSVDKALNTAVVSISTGGDLVAEEHALHLGSTLPYGDAVITLFSVDTNSISFAATTNALACEARDQQTPMCRGGSACCGGSCEELPVCGGRLDGPVNSCLDRQLYCCNGALSFIACGAGPGPICGNDICEPGEATLAQVPPITCSVDGTVFAPSNQNFLGLVGNELQIALYYEASIPYLAQMYADAGVKQVRIVLNWKEIETENNVFSWSYVDKLAGDLNQAGIHPVGIIANTPDWASSCAGTAQSQECIAKDLAEYENFVRTAVQRYGPAGTNTIHDWEIRVETKTNGVLTKEQYVQELNAAYAVIKQEDPIARVWGPEIFFVITSPGAYDWAQYVIANGNYDVFAIHQFHNVTTAYTHTKQIRQMLDDAGQQDIPLAVSAMNSEYQDPRTQEAQAQALKDLYACVSAAGADYAMWFAGTEWPDVDDPNKHGIFDYDFTLPERVKPKLAYYALKELGDSTLPPENGGTCPQDCENDQNAFFVMAVDDSAPTSDVLLTIDVAQRVQELHPEVPIGAAQLFSTVDGLDLDGQVTLAVYHGEAVIIVGATSPTSHVTYAIDLAGVLTDLGIEHRLILSNQVPTSNLRDLFSTTQICSKDADCPPLNCVQEPCAENLCVQNTCQELYIVERGGKACTTVADCPAYACVTQPCDVRVCYQGQCALASQQAPGGVVVA